MEILTKMLAFSYITIYYKNVLTPNFGAKFCAYSAFGRNTYLNNIDTVNKGYTYSLSYQQSNTQA